MAMVRSPRFWMFLGATAAVAGSGAAWLTKRIKPDLIDWGIVRSIARRFSARPGDLAPPLAPLGRYEGVIAASRQAVSAYLERPVTDVPAPVAVLDRESWIDVNIANFRNLLAPVDEAYRRLNIRDAVAGRLASGAATVAMSVQIGAMLGFLSRRVLGQYDIPLLEPGEGTIYLIDANIESLARRMGLRPADLRQWVALHETSHAVEFESTPWLQEYMAGLLRAYLDEAGETILNPRRIRERLAPSAERKHDGLKLGGLLRLMLSDKQVGIVAQIQALMSVMEGYSNHAMRATGASLIPNYRFLAARMNQREKARGLAFRALSRLFGLDLKLEQYVIGENFVNHVVKERNVGFVNRVWDSPASLPSLEEVREPESWVRRIESAGA